LTFGVDYGLFIQGAACGRDNSDSEADFCVKFDDNSAEADSPRRGFISNDTAAALEMEVNSVKETLCNEAMHDEAMNEVIVINEATVPQK
jgi:hypothetical protein